MSSAGRTVLAVLALVVSGSSFTKAAAAPLAGSPLPHEAQLFGHPDPGQAGAAFGHAVSVFGNTALVGAVSEDTAGGSGAGAVYVFVRSGGTWYREARLVASDGAAADQFGISVSLSGDTAVVGAFGDDTAGGGNAGSAYVFVRTGSSWTQQQKLTAPDGSASDGFGFRVSVSGDTVVVGAPNDDTAIGADAGSAYVFVRSGTTWSLQQHLLPSDAEPDQLFGSSVSVTADTAIVGAPFDTTNGIESGAAYVFVRSGTTWTEQQKLLASDGAMGDLLGVSVSLSGDTAAVGAFGATTPQGAGAGAAFVFVRASGTWTEQQKVVAPDGAAADHFGAEIAVAADTLVVGAPDADVPNGAGSGSAYVFLRSGTTWSLQQKLFPPDGAAGDAFGSSVSVSGSTAAVGAPSDNVGGVPGAGSAPVFVSTGAAWGQQLRLTPDLNGFDAFGSAVAVSGDVAVVGAPFDVLGSPFNVPPGSAYVFVRSGTTWSEQQKLTVADPNAYAFGRSVALDGDTIVIGASAFAMGGGSAEGFAFVFVRSGTTWTLQQRLEAPDGTSTNDFGTSVTVAGDRAVIGSPGAPPGMGAAYSFLRSGAAWTFQQKVLPADGLANDGFGAAVSITADTLVVGSPGDDTAAGTDAGSAYVFARSGSLWVQEQKLTAPDAAAGDVLGSSVSIDGETAAIGASFDDTPGGSNAGSTYVFVRGGVAWTLQQKLVASDGNIGHHFGSSVSLSGDAVAIGAPQDGIPGGPGTGAAYVFARTGTTWMEHAELLAPDGAAGDSLGQTVSLSGDTVAVGAPFDATPDGADAGSAHIFRGSVPVELQSFVLE